MRSKKFERILYHEAGHATLSYLLSVGIKEISAKEGCAYVSNYEPEGINLNSVDPYKGVSREEIKKRIKILIVGQIAEEIKFGDFDGNRSDDKKALDLATYLHHKRINTILKELKKSARELIKSNWSLVESIAEIIENKKLSGEEFYNFIKEVRNDG